MEKNLYNKAKVEFSKFPQSETGYDEAVNKTFTRHDSLKECKCSSNNDCMPPPNVSLFFATKLEWRLV